MKVLKAKQKKKTDQVKDLAKKLGKEDLEMNGSMLVDVLNERYGQKDNDTPFQYGDIQQYYLRSALPDKYGGFKLEMREGPIGKYLVVFKKEEKEDE